MLTTNVTVPAGTLVHVSAGESCSPACVYLMGITPPSGHAEVASVSGVGRGGAAGGVCACAVAAMVTHASNATRAASPARSPPLDGRQLLCAPAASWSEVRRV